MGDFYQDKIEIRMANLEDVEAILHIYSYYVENTAISFEYVTPTIEEFKGRMENTLKKYPYLLALDHGKIVGYAYAGVFKNRAAYNHCVETSVYVEKNHRKKGVGKALYHELEDRCKSIGIRNMYACIAVCDKEDEYLTNNSWHFHEHLGFEVVGKFHACGKKFGNDYDMIWMEKILS